MGTIFAGRESEAMARSEHYPLLATVEFLSWVRLTHSARPLKGLIGIIRIG